MLMDPRKISRRMHLLRWAVPLTLAAFVVFYQLVFARWIQDTFGIQAHNIAEILIYATSGPLLAFLVLDYLGRWIEEKETSELQAQMLAETRENLLLSRELSDDALQTLYAVSVVLTSLESTLRETSPGTARVLQETEEAVEGSMSRLREHLQILSAPKNTPFNGNSSSSPQSDTLVAASTETNKVKTI